MVRLTLVSASTPRYVERCVYPQEFVHDICFDVINAATIGTDDGTEDGNDVYDVTDKFDMWVLRARVYCSAGDDRRFPLLPASSPSTHDTADVSGKHVAYQDLGQNQREQLFYTVAVAREKLGLIVGAGSAAAAATAVPSGQTLCIVIET